MKIGLGTVQFGLDYGISNPNGKTSPGEVEKILDEARQRGVTVLDTAALYGSSEQVLGEFLSSYPSFRVITKTPRFGLKITHNEADLLEKSFYSSLKRLHQEKVEGLLIHEADNLLADGGNYLFERMQELKQKKLLNKIGVSIYTPRQIEEILKRYSLDLIQIPFNILDQRLLKNGLLPQLKRLDIEIHARSVFLQGLLLMEPTELPAHFQPIEKLLENYRKTVEQFSLSSLEAALGFVLGIPEIDQLICGVNTHLQLLEILQAARPLDPEIFSEFAVDEESILNPSQWMLT